MSNGGVSRKEVVEIVRNLGEFIHGGDVEGTAQHWLSHGVLPDEAWVDAGVFTPEAQTALDRLGLLPEEVAQSMVDLTGDEDHRFGHERIGYLVSNCDISAEDAFRVIRGGAQSPPPVIEVIGLGSEDWTDVLVDEDEGIESVAEWERYGTVEVRIDGVTYEAGCVIGVPEYLRGTARAAGGDMVTPYLDAWFADASDYMEAPGDNGSKGIASELYADLLAALAEAAPRLWQEHQEEAGE